MVPSVFADYPWDCNSDHPYLWSNGECKFHKESFLKNMCPSTDPYRWSDNYCHSERESFLENGCPYHSPYEWSNGECKFHKESFLKNMCPSTDPYRWSDNYCHALTESGLKIGCPDSYPYEWSDGTCNIVQESKTIPISENPQNIQAMYLVSIIVVIGVIIGIVFAFRNKKRESSAVPSPPVPSPPVPSPPPVPSSPTPLSSPTSENVLKSEDLVDHKQTSDDQINKNCSLCKVSFPSSQAMLQHTIEKHSLVNIKWQEVFLFMPFVSIWAFYRIKKLGKGLLLALGLDSLFFGIIFLMLMVSNVSNNENGTIVFFIGVMFVWLGMIWLRIHYMIKWSRQWNKKRDIQIESLSNEPKQD